MCEPLDQNHGSTIDFNHGSTIDFNHGRCKNPRLSLVCFGLQATPCLSPIWFGPQFINGLTFYWFNVLFLCCTCTHHICVVMSNHKNIWRNKNSDNGGGVCWSRYLVFKVGQTNWGNQGPMVSMLKWWMCLWFVMCVVQGGGKVGFWDLWRQWWCLFQWSWRRAGGDN